MLRFVASRLFSAVPTIFIVVTMVFLPSVLHLGAFQRRACAGATRSCDLMRAYQLDQPVWHSSTFTTSGTSCIFDFGPSYIYRDFHPSRSDRPEPSVFARDRHLRDGHCAGWRCRGRVVAALRQNGAVDYTLMSLATVG